MGGGHCRICLLSQWQQLRKKVSAESLKMGMETKVGGNLLGGGQKPKRNDVPERNRNGVGKAYLAQVRTYLYMRSETCFNAWDTSSHAPGITVIGERFGTE